MRSPERALLKRAVMIQMVRNKIPSRASGAAEHYCELWPDVNPLPRKAFHSALVSTSHAARCVACHGVRSHADAVALVIECSIPVV